MSTSVSVILVSTTGLVWIAWMDSTAAALADLMERAVKQVILYPRTHLVAIGPFGEARAHRQRRRTTKDMVDITTELAYKRKTRQKK